MFGKLMKYDLKMTLEKCVPLYIIAFLLALTNGALIRFGGENYFETMDMTSTLNQILSIAYGLFAGGSVFIIAAIIPICGILIIARFYKGVFDREGYLTNTLPVTCHQIIGAKYLTAFISILVSGFVLIFIGTCFFFLLTPMGLQDILDLSSQYKNDIPISSILTFILACVCQLTTVIMQIYLSIAIGHLCKHRVLASIGTYFGIQYFVNQPIILIALLSTGITQAGPQHDVFTSMNLYLIYAAILNLVLAGAYYFFTAFIMKKKLNLQ